MQNMVIFLLKIGVKLEKTNKSETELFEYVPKISSELFPLGSISSIQRFENWGGTSVYC